MSTNFGIKISLFSSEQILNYSYGRILNSKTLNYKSFKPEMNGLFCDRVFGSSDKNCYCGKNYNYDESGWICSRCGVETSLKENNFKRSRMGHIRLYDYFINPLYYKSFPYYLSVITGLSKKDILKILYSNYYLILYSDINFLKINDVINSNSYFFLKKKYCNNFYALNGIKAFYEFLKNFNFENEILKIKNKFVGNYNKNFKKNNFNKKLIKRYNFIKNFFYNKINPLNIFIKNLIVLPPDLRPIVKLPDDTVVSSDLNELYKRIINSNLRLKKIKFFFSSPLKILFNEKKILQSHIDNLYLGGGVYNEKPLKSLTDNLKGKTGFFRNNLLGKRVDYSGRAVIVSGANLKFGECAIPKKIAFELFRPFIYNIILKNEIFNIKTSKTEVDNMSNIAYLVLINLIKNFYVLLNRAPTLHKLGIQSFKILITEENAIKLHPLVCSAYNADFDGDQMAIHIPITIKSSVEFKHLLYSGNNIFYPSNGTCCILPTKDMILGIYSFSKFNYFDFYNFKFFFNNIYEVFLAFNLNYIYFDTIIFIRFKEFDFVLNKLIYKIYKTTFSRIIIFNLFPYNYFYDFLNKNLNKSAISKIIDFLIYKYNYNFSSNLCNNLMNLGFYLSTFYGFSISIDDIFFDFNKKKKFKTFEYISAIYNLNYLNFFFTKKNKKKKFLDLWETASNLITNTILKNLGTSKILDLNGLFLNTEFSTNSLNIMANSGARCSEAQIKQICGSRGFVNYKREGIFDFFILSGLREGLNIFEYFYFSHNSRKTLADTALKTSSAGYLTRRLVEISHNISILQYDCGVSEGLLFKSLIHQGELIEDFFDRIFGRIMLKNFISYSKRIFIKKNTFINENIIKILKNNNINSIMIRTPIKCKLRMKGLCTLCYGLDLSKGKLVSLGEMVGVVAAQAIGEPGTQLTMRTFHSGGAVNILTKKSFYSSNSKGFLRYPSSLKYVLNKEGFKIVISKFSTLKIYNNFNENLESFNVPYSSNLFFENNSRVDVGDIICKWDSNYYLIISEYNGFLKFFEFFDNLNFVKRNDLNCFEIIFYKIIPSIIIYDDNKNKILKKYFLKVGDLIMFKNNDFINIGDVLIKHPKNFVIAEDIIGGLPKIDNLFEARIPKNKSFLSPVEGLVKINILGNKNILNIIKNNNVLFSFIVPSNLSKNLVVCDDQILNKGDIIINGDTNPHDILFLHGLDYFVNFMLEEIKYIYFLQGVKINDKHLEIIIAGMLRSAVVTHSGHSNFLPGDIVLLEEIYIFNDSVVSFSGKIKYKIILTGITKQSLKNKSFLSSASFQKTSFVLSDAGINYEVDNMNTLKSFIMTGKIYPSGTGSYSNLLKF